MYEAQSDISKISDSIITTELNKINQKENNTKLKIKKHLNFDKLSDKKSNIDPSDSYYAEFHDIVVQAENRKARPKSAMKNRSKEKMENINREPNY